MTDIKLQQKNYKENREPYQLVLPFDYEVIIPDNDSVRLLSRIVEGMDLSKLYAAYSSLGRNPSPSPRTLLKILVYSYMEGNYSSRKIERASRRDLNYMWLLVGESAPDHSTVSRFRKDRLGELMEGLFYQFVQKLCSLGEVTYENVFADGTKLEANANRYTFVWKRALEKNEMKMHMKADALAEEINKLYFTSYHVMDKNADMEMYKMIRFLEGKMPELEITPVCGSGQRKSNEQKLLEALREYRERQEKYD